MSAKRLMIPAFIVLLAVLVAVMARTLWVDLDDLSTAGNDNAQWTIIQLDAEFANLHATLLEQAARPETDRASVRLRTDITLSRIGLVSQGNAADILASDRTALALLDRIRDFADQAAALVDGDLDAAAIQRLTELTSATAPLARRLALRGIQIGAERTEARRLDFANTLRNTGLVAIFVIGALAAVMAFLDRLLWIAREKDRALSASSKRLESTIAGSLDAIVTSDEKGKILDFNPAAERIFDWKKKEIAGRKIDLLLPGWKPASGQKEDADTGNAFRKYLDQGRVEITARRRTGEVFPADLTVTSADGDSHDLVIVYLRDISDQKLSEQALVDAKERAERTDRAKSRFLTVMSHEMRTPLNGVLGVLDLLRTTKLSGKQMRYLDVATASSEVLMRQVNEALDITRIETGSLVLASHRFGLADEVRRVATVLEPLAKEKGIGLSLDIDPGMELDFVADGIRIGQIITNLVGNAIKFTDAGSVDITVTGIRAPAETAATIVVKDTGIGIPDRYTEAIFEDFVALSHSSGRMSRSDGLGLSISRKTARLMGGDIKVSSVQGSGSEFTLTLPLKRAHGSDRPYILNNAIASRQFDTGSRVSILIVEDNNINRNVLRDMLEGMGHSVAVAVNGREGYELALRQPFDLIFMDINMPELDGIELTEKIRKTDGPNRTARIHGLTAYGEEEYLAPAKAAGMDGFSTKPIRMQDLADILSGDHVDTSAAPATSGDIDLVVVDELREALGDARLRENVEDFFREMDDALARMKRLELPGDREELAAQLHNLSGAAALFGFRGLTDGVAAVRAETRKGNIRAVVPMLGQLETLSRQVRHRFFELNPATEADRTVRAADALGPN